MNQGQWFDSQIPRLCVLEQDSRRVSPTWDVDLDFVLQVCPSQVAVERHGPVTLWVGPQPLWVGQVLHAERETGER